MVTKSGELFVYYDSEAWRCSEHLTAMITDPQLSWHDTVARTSPWHVPFPERVWQASAGKGSSAVVTQAGHLYTCGQGRRDAGGRLGHGDGRVAVPQLTRVEPLLDEFVVEVVAAADHTVVRAASGAVYTFGLGERGVLGHGDYAPQRLPKRVLFESATLVPVAAHAPVSG